MIVQEFAYLLFSFLKKQMFVRRWLNEALENWPLGGYYKDGVCG